MDLRNLINCIEPHKRNEQSLSTVDTIIRSNHNGRLFGVSAIASIGASSTAYLSMKTSATKVTHCLAPLITGSKTCFVYYGIDAVVTDATGSDITIFSNNHELSASGDSVSTTQSYKLTPTVTNDGTIFYNDGFYAGLFSGGNVQTNVGWVLEKDTQYIAKIVNQDAQAGWIKFAMFWIEHDE